MSGPIPEALGLTDLEELELGDNRLSGTIPGELADLGSLGRLDLGGNQLSGCVPHGLMRIMKDEAAALGLPFCASTPTPTPARTPAPIP